MFSKKKKTPSNGSLLFTIFFLLSFTLNVNAQFYEQELTQKNIFFFSQTGKRINWNTSLSNFTVEAPDSLYSNNFHKNFSFIGTKNKFDYKLIPILYGGYDKYNFGINRVGGLYASLKLKNWSFLMRFQEGYATKERINKSFLFKNHRYNYRIVNKAVEYSELIGHIKYDWSWGHVALKYDRPSMGNYVFQSNIISGNAPTYGLVELHAQPFDWISFDYFHGALNSNVVDSTRSYTYTGGFRRVDRPKYIAANMINIFPWKHIKFSLGNSVIYADNNIDIGYLFPFFFYRTIDHNNGGFRNDIGQNGQLFLSTSYNNKKNIYLHTTLFVDELRISSIGGDKSDDRNQISFQVGGQLKLKKGLVFSTEYTANFPYAYRHHIPTTTFEHSQYNLGHFAGDNASNFDAQLDFFYKTWKISSYFSRLVKGKYVPFNENLAGTRSGVPFLEDVLFTKRSLGISVSYSPFLYTQFTFRANYDIFTGDFESFYPEKWTDKMLHFNISGGVYF